LTGNKRRAKKLDAGEDGDKGKKITEAARRAVSEKETEKARRTGRETRGRELTKKTITQAWPRRDPLPLDSRASEQTNTRLQWERGGVDSSDDDEDNSGSDANARGKAAKAATTTAASRLDATEDPLEEKPRKVTKTAQSPAHQRATSKGPKGYLRCLLRPRFDL